MEKKRLVVLSGSGISAESGLKTFRDSDGLWENYNVYEVATPDAWQQNPRMVLDFYNARRRQIRASQPNRAHEVLAGLEQWMDVHIITQNIDDLHERAGSRRILHLHGEIMKARSILNEKKLYDLEDRDIAHGDLAPDGGQLRPHVVWFGEPVPAMDAAMEWVHRADFFLVIGTSLNVYPAAGLIHFVPRRSPVYVIDPQEIPISGINNRVISIRESAIRGVEMFEKAIKDELEK